MRVNSMGSVRASAVYLILLLAITFLYLPKTASLEETKLQSGMYWKLYSNIRSVSTVTGQVSSSFEELYTVYYTIEVTHIEKELNELRIKETIEVSQSMKENDIIDYGKSDNYKLENFHTINLHDHCKIESTYLEPRFGRGYGGTTSYLNNLPFPFLIDTHELSNSGSILRENLIDPFDMAMYTLWFWDLRIDWGDSMQPIIQDYPLITEIVGYKEIQHPAISTTIDIQNANMNVFEINHSTEYSRAALFLYLDLLYGGDLLDEINSHDILSFRDSKECFDKVYGILVKGDYYRKHIVTDEINTITHEVWEDIILHDSNMYYPLLIETLPNLDTINSTIKGRGWYIPDDTAIFSTEPDVPMSGLLGLIGVKYEFVEWHGEFTSSRPVERIVMDSPKKITAVYTINYIPLYILSILVLLFASSFFFVFKRRKRKPFPKMTTSVELEKATISSVDTKHCIFCGELIPEIAEFCEKCGKKVKLQ